MTVTAYDTLHELCNSRGVNNAFLGRLSLLGLQPCFEDTILLAPIFLAMFFLGSYRVHQCIKSGLYNRTATEQAIPIIKLLCCLANLIANIVLLALINQPARFQKLVYPLGIAGWFAMSLAAAVELRYFSYNGQWISRFAFLWIFVCYCIRWPTQRALGDIPNSHFYYSCFIACWTAQGTAVVMFYFEKYVTFEEFTANNSPYVPASMDERIDAGDKSFGIETAPSRKISSESTKKQPRVEVLRRLHRSAAEESVDMAPVKWTTINNPEGVANPISRMLLLWMTPLFVYCHKNTIDFADVWELRAYFRAIDNFHNFEFIWQDEKTKAGKDGKPLRKTILRCFGMYFLTAAPLLAIQNVAQLALPFLLGPLIKYMGDDEPVLYGWMYSIGFFIALMIMTGAENQVKSFRNSMMKKFREKLHEFSFLIYFDALFFQISQSYSF